MTAKEYLSQAYRLNQWINIQLREVDELRRLATSLAPPDMGDRVMSTRPTEAPFVKHINRLVDLERDLDAKIDGLVALRTDISKTIAAVPNEDERLVLHLRYLDGYNWEQIADELGVVGSTVRRWHNNGLRNVILPAHTA